MNRDDIIRMAREAGLHEDDGVWYSRSDVDADVTTDDLERFANLVAAAERKHCYDLIETLVKAEREACAKVCEETNSASFREAGCPAEGGECAAAIRARGE